MYRLEELIIYGFGETGRRDITKCLLLFVLLIQTDRIGSNPLNHTIISTTCG